MRAMGASMEGLLNIMIVEDSAPIAGRLKFMVGDLLLHKSINIASSIARAHDLMQETVPDVVILDIHLQGEEPGVTGLDLLKTIRKDYGNMVVMMLTNYSDEFYKNKCKELGADYFFDKSADFDKVSEALKAVSVSKSKVN
jgi:DNA-binding NarL/FixJ family response regulator